jgi:hypothetical protein
VKIYLAGAINGCTDEECIDWREYVKSKVGAENTLDPMRRDYRGKEMERVNEIVEGDKADIESSTHLMVNFEKASVGTSMEILFAWEKDLPIIVVTPKEIKLSPWLIYHVDKIVHTYDEAIEWCKNN